MGHITDKQYHRLCDQAAIRSKNMGRFRYGMSWGLWRNTFWSLYQLRAQVRVYCREVKAYSLQLVGPYPNHEQPLAFWLKIIDDELARRARIGANA